MDRTESNQTIEQEFKPCQYCGMPTKTPDMICNSCRSRIITLNKLYEFYKQFYKSTDYLQSINNYMYEKDNLRYIRGKSKWGVFWGIWITIGFIVGPIMLIALTTITDDNAMGVTFVLGIISAILLAVFIITINSVTKYGYEQDAIANKHKQENISRLDKLIQAEYQKIHDLYVSTNKYVPEEYSSLNTVAALIQLIESKRADSLKDAINLYENIKHTNEMLRLQQEMGRNSRLTAVASQVSAIANVTTAINTL